MDESSYREEKATHSDPESCAPGREAEGEALTGEGAGRVSSSEIVRIQGADTVRVSGRQHQVLRQSQAALDPAESETPSTHRSLVHGSREIPPLTARDGLAARNGNPKGATRR